MCNNWNYGGNACWLILLLLLLCGNGCGSLYGGCGGCGCGGCGNGCGGCGNGCGGNYNSGNTGCGCGC